MPLYICQDPYDVQRRVNSNVNYGLWVIVMCQCRFISYSKCTLWCNMLMVEEGMCPGGRVYVGALCTYHSTLL